MEETIETAVTNAAAGAIIGHELATTAAAMAAIIHHADEDKLGRPFLVTPEGALTNMEGYLPNPVMRRGDVVVHDSSSFAAYVNRFKDADTVIFADQIVLAFCGVIDYHRSGPDGVAQWARHRVTLPLQLTEAWKEWVGKDKTAMNQADFATWIEDRIPDIVRPDGADLVMMARTLEAKKDVSFKSHIRADNGSHVFHFNEIVQGTAQDGNIVIPTSFDLSLTPFLGADAKLVTARFRYKLTGGQLSLSYELVRYKDVLIAAFEDELEDIRSTVADVTVLAGPAPAAQTAQ